LSFEMIASFRSVDRLLLATLSVAAIDQGGIGMNNRLFNCLIAGTLATTLAVASPALGRGGGGGGGHGGGMGGGMHGGMGGGMHGGMGGGMHGGMGGGMHGGGGHFSGTHFGGGRFAAASFAHPGFSHRSARFAFHDRGHFHHRFHHRFNRFAFFGAPYAYAAYDSCWRRTWTPYGMQWVNVCSDYGY
jgi:hypothetical protein